MNTKSLRNLCEYPDGRKVPLKYQIRVTLGNWHIVTVYAWKIIRHLFQFWWTECNKNYVNQKFNLTRCLTLNNMRLQTKCPCYTTSCVHSIILQLNIYFKWQKYIKFYTHHYKQTSSTQFCSATYTNMLYREAGVQNSKNILTEWDLRFQWWWLGQLLFLVTWLCANWSFLIPLPPLSVYVIKQAPYPGGKGNRIFRNASKFLPEHHTYQKTVIFELL